MIITPAHNDEKAEEKKHNAKEKVNAPSDEPKKDEMDETKVVSKRESLHAPTTPTAMMATIGKTIR